MRSWIHVVKQPGAPARVGSADWPSAQGSSRSDGAKVVLRLQPTGRRRAMAMVGKCLVSLCCLHQFGFQIWGQVWPVPTAAGRLRLERAAGSPWPASVGAVEVWPGPTEASYWSIFTEAGAQVNTFTYWSGADGTAKLSFNTSSGKTVYYLYFDKNPPPAMPAWKPEAGLLLETRNCRNLPVNTSAQFRTLLRSSTVAYGRSYVPNVFQGLNPHGPSSFYLAFYDGFFRAPQTGEYGFATISTDASYLSIDGRLVAEWLGRHGPDGGRHGEHNGNLQLAAGKHRLEYVQAQFDGPPAAVAAWRRPGQGRFEVMPPSAFEPVARFQATACETPPAALPTLYLEWQTTEHSAVDGLGIYWVQCRVVRDARPRTYHWSFDDGTERQGERPQHLYFRPGRRQVTVEALAGQARVAAAKATIDVQPNWAQPEEWRQALYDQASQELLTRDLSGLPSPDLLAVVELAERVDDTNLVCHAGNYFLKRQDQFQAAAHAAVFFRLGLSSQHRGDLGNQRAVQALRRALALAQGNPVVREKAKLRLADLLLHGYGKPVEAAALLNPVPAAVLTDAEKRLARLLSGDLCAVQGKLDEAKKIFAALEATARKPAADAELRRRAKVESAELFFHGGAWEAAEQILDQVVMDNPPDRLALEINLPLLKIYLARKEYQRALAAGQLLLKVTAGNPHESELLWHTAEAAFALGQTIPGQEALAKLLRDFPYSESAARAKDRGKIPASAHH